MIISCEFLCNAAFETQMHSFLIFNVVKRNIYEEQIVALPIKKWNFTRYELMLMHFADRRLSRNDEADK